MKRIYFFTILSMFNLVSVMAQEKNTKVELNAYGEVLPYTIDVNGNEITDQVLGVGISASKFNYFSSILNFKTKGELDGFIFNQESPLIGAEASLEFSLNATTPDKRLSAGGGIGGQFDVLTNGSKGFTNYYFAEGRISNGDLSGYGKVMTPMTGSRKINGEVGLSVKM